MISVFPFKLYVFESFIIVLEMTEKLFEKKKINSLFYSDKNGRTIK